MGKHDLKSSSNSLSCNQRLTATVAWFRSMVDSSQISSLVTTVALFGVIRKIVFVLCSRSNICHCKLCSFLFVSKYTPPQALFLLVRVQIYATASFVPPCSCPNICHCKLCSSLFVSKYMPLQAFVPPCSCPNIRHCKLCYSLFVSKYTPLQALFLLVRVQIYATASFVPPCSCPLSWMVFKKMILFSNGMCAVVILLLSETTTTHSQIYAFCLYRSGFCQQNYVRLYVPSTKYALREGSISENMTRMSESFTHISGSLSYISFPENHTEEINISSRIKESATIVSEESSRNDTSSGNIENITRVTEISTPTLKQSQTPSTTMTSISTPTPKQSQTPSTTMTRDISLYSFLAAGGGCYDEKSDLAQLQLTPNPLRNPLCGLEEHLPKDVRAMEEGE
uniref:Uncharacterized protein n=2 Tax=Timema TaxID=61471 RepID=A0A7R9HDB7_TIMPO|nr:unnamed protein product [Timema poppensis]